MPYIDADIKIERGKANAKQEKKKKKKNRRTIVLGHDLTSICYPIIFTTN